MKLYGRKFAHRHIDKRVRQRTETRDAVLWEIDWVSYKAKVKIQGSNEYVIAHFPRNLKQKPRWLRVGNAVAIRHRSGSRGYVEITGEGRAIPSPVSGGALPVTTYVGEDGVISGAEVHQTYPNATNAVKVEHGTYRIDNVIYTLDPATLGYVVMDDPAALTMGDRTVLGTGNYTLLFPASPPSGEHIYYGVVTSASGEVELISGEASTTPSKPDVPTGHILLGDYIFVPGGTGVVDDYLIGAEWSAPEPSTCPLTFPSLTAPNNEFEWDAGDNYPETNVVCTVRDQYGYPLETAVSGYTAALEMKTGTGQIWSEDYGGWTNGSVTQTFGSSGGAYTFKYRRDQTVTESSPILKITVYYGTLSVQDVATIVLLDAVGGVIP